MKIGILSSFYSPYIKGGGEVSVKKLAEGLYRRNHEVFVVSTAKNASIEYINGIKIYRIRHKNIYWSFNSSKKFFLYKFIWHFLEGYNPFIRPQIKKILIKENPDIIHVRNSEEFSSYLYKLLKVLKIPSAVTLNSYTWLCPKSTMFKNVSCSNQCVSCALTTLLKKRMSKYVENVIGVSNYTLKQHTKIRYFKNAKKHVIYTSPPLTKCTVKNTTEVVFGMLGRLHPTKGQYQIIEIFNSYPQLKLIVSGTGPTDYVQKCKSLSVHSKNIIFTGETKPNEFFNKINVLIINSLWKEPFPRTLVESFANATPVMASSNGGTKEMIIPNKNGFVYNNYEELISYISFVNSNPASLEPMQDFIKKNIQNWPDEIDMHLDVYRSMLK